MTKGKKIALFIIIPVVLIAGGIGVYYGFIKKKDSGDSFGTSGGGDYSAQAKDILYQVGMGYKTPESYAGTLAPALKAEIVKQLNSSSDFNAAQKSLATI